MKKEAITLSIFVLIFAIFLFSSKDDKMTKPDTPGNAAMLIKYAIDEGNYNRFNKYFSDGRKNKVSEQQFEELKKSTTAAWSNSLYEVIESSNGEMLLVRLSPVKIDGEYKVQDVIKVPENMRNLFNEK